MKRAWQKLRVGLSKAERLSTKSSLKTSRWALTLDFQQPLKAWSLELLNLVPHFLETRALPQDSYLTAGAT